MSESPIEKIQNQALEAQIVEVIWEPPWTPEKMSEAARLQLNM